MRWIVCYLWKDEYYPELCFIGAIPLCYLIFIKYFIQSQHNIKI